MLELEVKGTYLHTPSPVLHPAIHLILTDMALLSIGAQTANYISSHLHLLHYKIMKTSASHELPGIG